MLLELAGNQPRTAGASQGPLGVKQNRAGKLGMSAGLEEAERARG